MNVIFDIPTTDAMDRCFLTWVPVKAQVRLENADTSSATHRVTLRNVGTPGGGKVIFDTKRSDDGERSLAIDLPTDGSPVDVWVAGEFREPSIEYGDAVIEAVNAAGTPVGTRELMVRIRKNAVQLTANERNRFLRALGTLNDAGRGPFQSFRDMHTSEAVNEAHGFAGFLPWHRAYLLDLERSLQEIDATVTLPYWRFDEPATDLFAPEFFGMPDPDPANGDTVSFPHGHPLEYWQTDRNADPIKRRPNYDIAGPPPQVSVFDGRPVAYVILQATTLRMGGQAHEFALFRHMEGPPHGAAHNSFAGQIRSTGTAPKDPLFFLLHCNVDRLWAFWQWFHKRTNEDTTAAYPPDGSVRADNSGKTIGSALDDTMWPWNGERSDPRPDFDPPRPTFPPSPFIAAPGSQPTVRSMVDFQGVHTEIHLGFGYDDVPFELEAEDRIA